MSSNDKSTLSKGTNLNSDKYEIVEEIGVGGYGNVFLALDNAKKR